MTGRMGGISKLTSSAFLLVHVCYVMLLLPIKPQLFQFDHLMIVATPFCPAGIHTLKIK